MCDSIKEVYIYIMASDREMNDHDNNIMLDNGIYIYMLCMYVICTFKTLCAVAVSNQWLLDTQGVVI